MLTLHASDAFREMLGSIKTPYDECIATLLKNMKLDPYFEKFYYWARDNNVPIVILSSGMKPIISALLEKFLGHKPGDHLHIVCNEVVSRDGKDINSEGGWEIKYHDDRYVIYRIQIISSAITHGPPTSSHFGHDKSLEIKPYAALPDGERPVLLYAGDGVSDLSAAAETNLLFAKAGKGKLVHSICQHKNGLEISQAYRSGDLLRTPRHALHHLPGLVYYPFDHSRYPRW